MSDFSFNVSELADRLAKNDSKSREVTKVPLSTNQNKFVKVAFDMFESKFDHSIWELEDSGEEQYLVKRMDLDDHGLEVEAGVEAVTHSGDGWSAAGSSGAPVVLYFLSVPVREFSREQFAYDDKSMGLFAESLIQTVCQNKKVAREFVGSMRASDKKVLKGKCTADLLHDDTRLVYSWLQEG